MKILTIKKSIFQCPQRFNLVFGVKDPLMIGFKISGRDSADVVQEALGKGLMMLTAKDRIRLLPPLVITYDEIDTGLKILENCI